MIKTIKAKEGLKLGDKYMNNDLREQVVDFICNDVGQVIHDADADELITLIRTATLDEVKDAVDGVDSLCVYRTQIYRAIDNLRGADNG